MIEVRQYEIERVVAERKQHMGDWINYHQELRGLAQAAALVTWIALHTLLDWPAWLAFFAFVPVALYGVFASPWWMRRAYRRRHPINQWLRDQEAARP